MRSTWRLRGRRLNEFGVHSAETLGGDPKTGLGVCKGGWSWTRPGYPRAGWVLTITAWRSSALIVENKYKYEKAKAMRKAFGEGSSQFWWSSILLQCWSAACIEMMGF